MVTGFVCCCPATFNVRLFDPGDICPLFTLLLADVHHLYLTTTTTVLPCSSKSALLSTTPVTATASSAVSAALALGRGPPYAERQHPVRNDHLDQLVFRQPFAGKGPVTVRSPSTLLSG